LLDKLTYYDAIAHLIPGALACLFLLYILDILGLSLPKISQGSLAQVGIGIIVSYVAGHLLQAVASTAEPFYYISWGGRPSINLLAAQSRTFPEVQREKLIEDLTSYFKISEALPQEKKGKGLFYRNLFEHCMAVCNREKLGRVELFEASYSLHRALLTTFALFFLTSAILRIFICNQWLIVQHEKPALLTLLLWATGVGTAIEFFRARKRAYYYVREVLWMSADYIHSKQPNRI